MEQQQNWRSTLLQTYKQILFAITGCLVLISDGMHYSWSAPVLPILLAANTSLHITAPTGEWLESTYLIGGLLFVPLTILIVDRYGRKPAILVCSLLQLAAWLILLLARHPPLLFLARFIAGMSGDLCYVAMPIYIAETTDERIRGALSALIPLAMLVGTVLIYALGPFAPSYAPACIGLAIAALHFALFALAPESPYHLVGKQRPHEAKAALNRLRPHEDTQRLLDAITGVIEKERAQRGKLLDLFSQHNRKVLFISTYLTFGEHFAGFSVTLMNLHAILNANEASSGLASSSAALFFSLIMVGTVVVAAVCLDRCGRRPLLLLSCFCTAGCLAVLGAYFHCQERGVALAGAGWVPLAAVMVYAFVFKLGLGFIPNVLCAELYATNVKAVGMCLNDVMYVVFAFVSIRFYQGVSEAFGLYVVFYTFAVCTVLVGVLVYVHVPETMKKTLEEIQALLKSQAGAGGEGSTVNYEACE